MMKNLIIQGVIAVASLSACEGYLDTRPSNAIENAEAIRTEEDIATALRGAYDGLTSKLYYGAEFVIYGEVKGDDVQPYATRQKTEASYRFSWRKVDVPKGLWSVPYQVIRRVNFLLEEIDRNRVPLTDYVKDAKGQALALRALCHFDLLLTYSYPYLKDQGASLGIPLVDKTLDDDFLPAYKSVVEGYNMIIHDLGTALSLTGDKVRNGYFNRWAVKALLAKVNLYRGNWDEAWTYASDIVENGPYELIERDDYVASWGKEFSSEAILELSVSDISAGNKDLLGYIASPSGYAAMIATRDFVDLMNEDTGDIRLKLLVYNEKLKRWFINKYPGRKGYVAVNNIHILRLSDIYLMGAEAALKMGKPDQQKANEYLDAIRKRANPSTELLDATEALIFKERRKELVMEGARFFDAMRLGKTIHRIGGFHFLNKTDLISPNWDDSRIIAPIPQAENDVVR